MRVHLYLIFILLSLIISCAPAPAQLATRAPTAVVPLPTATPSDTPTPTATLAPSATASATTTATPTPSTTLSSTVTLALVKSPTLARTLTRTRTATTTPFATPATIACARPPDDYTYIKIGAHTVNTRTFWMLQLAKALYSGRGDMLHLNQGSYVNNLAASFGTHAGGGAVDIDIHVKNLSEELAYTEKVEMVHALRQAGFAAWLRIAGDLIQFNGDHIHAIAVGDRELSSEARRQLDGPEGYFRGLDGVPPDQGGIKPDRYGGPIICAWMIELGFKDLR